MKRNTLYAIGLSTAFTFVVALPGLQRSCNQNSTPDADNGNWPLTEADSALWVGQKLAKDLGWPEPEKAAQALAVIAKNQHDEKGISYREMYFAPVVSESLTPAGR